MNKNKQPCLVVLGRLHYPHASAPVNRTHLYCKALKESGGFPLIINLNSPFTAPQQFSWRGRYEGINFFYAQGTIYKYRPFLIRNLKKIGGMINSIRMLYRMSRTHQVKILLYTTTYFQDVVFFLFSRLIGVRVLKEFGEAPGYLLHGKRRGYTRNIREKFRVLLYDGVIVISEKLYNYYSEFLLKKQICQIPILVDLGRFDLRENTRVTVRPLLTYVGYMGGTKDGISELIRSMSIVKRTHPDFILNLVGSAEENDMKQLERLVVELQMEDWVVFAGKKSAAEINVILRDSYLLLLARPNNVQAQFGFPTKLGEYLASGNPVVVTRTGEIDKYLQHGKNAYIASPDNCEDFAEKVIYAMDHVSEAKAVGMAGREVAAMHFNYSLYSDKIFRLIN